VRLDREAVRLAELRSASIRGDLGCATYEEASREGFLIRSKAACDEALAWMRG